MATVFMKWLETNPKDYDRGIQLLTLGQIRRVKEKIASNYVQDGKRVLEIRCGTASLSLLMVKRGATVTGIDAAPCMLAEAEKKVKEAHLENCVSPYAAGFHHLAAHAHNHHIPARLRVTVGENRLPR